MRRDGRGPDVVQVGRRVLITHEAAREWQEARTVRALNGAAKNRLLSMRERAAEALKLIDAALAVQSGEKQP
ncbi:hypothetical protein [Paraburkholderia sp. BR13444]|uniref:hypothetical protein n=1 Tax=Paraburkholderia sp. BR13444 TaxID=3236997 RepID=UPI0034CD1025